MKNQPKVLSRPIKAVAESDAESSQSSRRASWRRNADAHSVTSKLGQRLREHREALGLSLNGASDATGVPMPTLSRIENNKMAPTFSVLLKVMTGLKLSWQSLMEAPGAPNSDEQIDVAVPADWETTSIAGYTYVLPHSGSSLSRVVQPLMFDVDARSLEEAGGLAGHQGIEFCFVISGKLQLHFAGQAPKELPTGGTALFNCAHPHAYVAKGRGKTRVLNIVVKDPLLTLDEAESPFEQRIKQISRST